MIALVLFVACGHVDCQPTSLAWADCTEAAQCCAYDVDNSRVGDCWLDVAPTDASPVGEVLVCDADDCMSALVDYADAYCTFPPM